tara:strand:- start:560 stop:712 length:153 start_codon:yes stop_codon:yes gene_type:complete
MYVYNYRYFLVTSTNIYNDIDIVITGISVWQFSTTFKEGNKALEESQKST